MAHQQVDAAFGDADMRVVWAPGGSGDLVGTCRCGARFVSPDPAAVWQWYARHRGVHTDRDM